MKRKIMIIDDAKEIREIFRMALEVEDYEVMDAIHGQDGFEKLSKLEKDLLPHLILLDLMMPVMDGHRFLEVIQGEVHLREIPIVVMTAKDGPTFPSVIQPRAVLRKPVDLDLLFSTVALNLPKVD